MKKRKNTIKKYRKLKRSFTNRKNKRTYRKMKRKSTKRRYSKRQQKGGSSFMDKLHKLAYDKTPHGKETIDEISKDLMEGGDLVNLEEKGDEWYLELESKNYPAYRTVLAKLDKDSSIDGNNHLDTFNRKLEEALKRKKEKESNWGSGSSNKAMLAAKKKTEENAAAEEEMKARSDEENQQEQEHNEELERLNKELKEAKREKVLEEKRAEIEAVRTGSPVLIAERVGEGSGEGSGEGKGSGKSEESGTTISNVNQIEVNVGDNDSNTSVKSEGGGKKKKKKKKKKRSKQKGG